MICIYIWSLMDIGLFPPFNYCDFCCNEQVCMYQSDYLLVLVSNLVLIFPHLNKTSPSTFYKMYWCTYIVFKGLTSIGRLTIKTTSLVLITTSQSPPQNLQPCFDAWLPQSTSSSCAEGRRLAPWLRGVERWWGGQSHASGSPARGCASLFTDIPFC